LAEVWFKPEGEPFALVFRIPQKSFEAPGLVQRLTLESLLKSVGIATEEVESWRYGDVSHAGMDGTSPELKQPLPPPPADGSHLEIHVSLKQPAPVDTPPDASQETAEDVPQEGGESETPAATGQDLGSRWNAIVGLETSIDSLRLSLEAVQVELETAWKQPLRPEEKVHALRADVVQWNKAKNRVHHAIPKVREFVHRATWAMGTPERKQLGELFETEPGSEAPVAPMERVSDELESLLKSRQILSAQGTAVYQECKGILAEIQGALRTLKDNAVRNERRKRDAMRAGGKFFKDIRRLSMGPP
jgi:hypothetical protein